MVYEIRFFDLIVNDQVDFIQYRVIVQFYLVVHNVIKIQIISGKGKIYVRTRTEISFGTRTIQNDFLKFMVFSCIFMNIIPGIQMYVLCWLGVNLKIKNGKKHVIIMKRFALNIQRIYKF